MSTQPELPLDIEREVRQRFEAEGVPPVHLELRNYPNENIVIVHVFESSLLGAATIASALDRDLQAKGFHGFVVVKGLEEPHASTSMQAGVRDQRALRLETLAASRSRASAVQPSLEYIPDSANNLQRAMQERHHLIFGRRGAGKTALMVEARKRLQEKGHVVVWENAQSLRELQVSMAFARIARAVLTELIAILADKRPDTKAYGAALSALSSLEQVLSKGEVSASLLVPDVNAAIRRFSEATGQTLYLFIDDLHYIHRPDQPQLLDYLHGCVRDADAWLKFACIRHLTRWFQQSPPLGLQTGHDADHIDLDVTLESPHDAKEFLETVLKAYAKHSGIPGLRSVFATEALDRLVLAAGAVPRDYLTLSASAIRQARGRERARLVGVQDVNKAAGDAAKTKLAELEEDAAAAAGSAGSILAALRDVRSFCLDEKRWTCFRVDFQDKETRPSEYNLLQELLDLRLIHLVNQSVSDEHAAGQRSVVYLLDLSQYSGERLKKQLTVLDFVSGELVMRRTGQPGTLKKGDTPKKLLGILRRPPLYPLQRLSAS